MIEGGLLEEVLQLYGHGDSLKHLKSFGYRHAGMVMAGQMDTP